MWIWNNLSFGKLLFCCCCYFRFFYKNRVGRWWSFRAHSMPTRNRNLAIKISEVKYTKILTWLHVTSRNMSSLMTSIMKHLLSFEDLNTHAFWGSDMRPSKHCPPENLWLEHEQGELLPHPLDKASRGTEPVPSLQREELPTRRCRAKESDGVSWEPDIFSLFNTKWLRKKEKDLSPKYSLEQIIIKCGSARSQNKFWSVMVAGKKKTQKGKSYNGFKRHSWNLKALKETNC